MFARTSLRAGRTVALTRSYTASTRVLFNGSAAVFQAEPIQSKEVHFRIAAKQAAGKVRRRFTGSPSYPRPLRV